MEEPKVMKLNNKGLTLVELVIAIAISTMIVGAAAMFLYNAERTYRVAEHSINLQMEAQILMEQMSNWVMEGNRMFVATEENDPTSAVINNVLVIYSIPRDNGKDVTTIYPTQYLNDPGYDATKLKASRRIIFVHEGKLYMTVTHDIADAKAEYKSLLESGSAKTLYSAADAVPENEIGEYVYRLHCDKIPSDVAMSSLSSIKMELGMVQGKQSYTTYDSFSLRNGLHEIPTPTPTAPPEGGGVDPDPDTP